MFYHMVSKQQEYDESVFGRHAKQICQRRRNRLEAQAAQMGLRLVPAPQLLTKNLAKPRVYTSAAPGQELAREYTSSTWRKSEVLGARDAPERDRPPLS